MELIKNLHQNEETIRKCNENFKRLFLIYGGAFAAIKEGNQWQSTDANSFNEYCEKYWGLKHAQIDNYIRVTREFGAEIEANPEFQGIKMTRLVEALPYITDSNKMELLHSAAQIPDARAWDNTIKALKGVKTTDECNHLYENGWQRCSKCNKFNRAMQNTEILGRGHEI